MTTTNDELEDRIALLGPGQTEEGKVNINEADVTGQYPTVGYMFGSSIQQAAYGAQVSSLTYGGGFGNIDLGEPQPVPSMNTKNRIVTTASGHSLEMDDTPGNERILIKHNSGNGIELRPDGSMAVSAAGRVVSITGDQKIIIEGDTTVVYNGNMDVEVAGDYNLNVRGNYNVNVGEDKAENVDGASRTTIDGNAGLTVKGNDSKTVLKTSTSTILGDNNIITKGIMRNTSEGNMQLSSGDQMHVSGKNKLFQSSENMNIAATDISLIGSTGVIGGPSIITHVNNIYATSATFTEGVTAPTFHGDLDGTSAITRSQTYAETATSGGAAITDTATNTTTRTAPTATLITDLLTKTTIGAVDVKVDIDNHFLKIINKSDATGGLSTKDLTVSEVRSKIRDQANLSNDIFVGNAVASGILDPSYADTTPPSVGRISGKGTEPLRGATPISNGTMNKSKFKAPQDNTTASFIPDVILQQPITNTTKLATNISMATFSGGRGDNGKISFDTETRMQAARNLQPHAELLKRSRVRSNKDFENYRLVVVEGLYKAGPTETVTEQSINWYKTQGRAVVYELHDNTGAIDIEKTFDMAVALKNLVVFEKLILDYDSFDPNSGINAQIIIIMPNLDSDYNVTEGDFFRNVETRYNGKVMSDNDLIEIKAT